MPPTDEALPIVFDPRMLIGGERVAGTGDEFRAISPSTGEEIEPAFRSGDGSDIDAAARQAEDAFVVYRSTAPSERAAFLDAIADEIGRDRGRLVARAHAESGLPLPRLNSELGRTTGQLRFFAAALRDGWPFDARIDDALPDRLPAPRQDLRLMQIPLGPVVVFGASNFPFAFSNAGGDTASALAAGCPVIVKCHEAHPGTALLVSEAVDRAVHSTGMPAGVYSALLARSHAFGAELVSHPAVRAVGFTGSRTGGTALLRAAAARPQPIPVYAEMSSVNPVVLLGAAANAETARSFADSLVLGSGQFCTNPGLLFVPADEHGDAFVTTAAAEIRGRAGTTMLTPGISHAFVSGVERLAACRGVRVAAAGSVGEDACSPAPHLLETTAADFLSEPGMQEEVFGAAALIVRCTDTDEVVRCLEVLGGQLTATLHVTPEDHDMARSLLPLLERLAGRIIVNGWPTGVEVADAMMHGGPFPSSSDGRSTSVGSLAIRRFLRPVAWQSTPQDLLPPALRDDNPWGLPRRVNSRLDI